MAFPFGKTIGGNNQFDVFTMTSTGGNWVVGTQIASIKQIRKNGKTGYSVSKNPKWTLDHDLDGPDIDTVLGYMVSSPTVETGEYNNGTVYGPNSGVATQLLAFISYGGVLTADSTRVADLGVVQVSGGDKSEESSKAVLTKLEFMGMENPVPLVFAANKFDTLQFATPVLTTLSAKSVCGQIRQAKAA